MNLLHKFKRQCLKRHIANYGLSKDTRIALCENRRIAKKLQKDIDKFNQRHHQLTETEITPGVTPSKNMLEVIPVRYGPESLSIVKTETYIKADFRFECPCCNTGYQFEISNQDDVPT